MPSLIQMQNLASQNAHSSMLHSSSAPQQLSSSNQQPPNLSKNSILKVYGAQPSYLVQVRAIPQLHVTHVVLLTLLTCY